MIWLYLFMTVGIVLFIVGLLYYLVILFVPGNVILLPDFNTTLTIANVGFMYGLAIISMSYILIKKYKK